MKRTNIQHLGSAFEEFFKTKGFYQKMQETAAKEAWSEVVGPVFSKSTKKVSIYKGVLYVSLFSPAVRNELLHNKTQIIQRINEKVGNSVVKSIVFS